MKIVLKLFYYALTMAVTHPLTLPNLQICYVNYVDNGKKGHFLEIQDHALELTNYHDESLFGKKKKKKRCPIPVMQLKAGVYNSTDQLMKLDH